MAIGSQLKLIKAGAAAWNAWRLEHPEIPIDLTNAHLGDVQLPKIDLRSASLNRVRLRWAYMREAQLHGATLTDADLRIIDLSKADLRNANLRGAQLSGAYLRDASLDGANLSGANLLGVNLDRASLRDAVLEGANLRNTVLTNVDLTRANLNNCWVFGASVWNATTTGATQQSLIITREGEPQIAVDNLKVAQFVYLIANNQELRDTIDSITSKVVLILGRFTPERKIILDAIRTEVRRRGFLPVMFDFDVPGSRDTDETVNLLARMAMFIIADLSSARSIAQELKGIVETLPSVPVQPIIQKDELEHGMFDHFRRYPWVLEPYRYESLDEVISSMGEQIISPVHIRAMGIRHTVRQV